MLIFITMNRYIEFLCTILSHAKWTSRHMVFDIVLINGLDFFYRAFISINI